MKIYAKSVNGVAKFSAAEKAKMLEHICSLDGKDIVFDIGERDKRSNKQNKYFWQLMTIMADEDTEGLDKEDWHDLFQRKYLTRDRVNKETGKVLIDPETGETEKCVKGTSELTKAEFIDFIAKVQRWAAIYRHINLPDPLEQTEIFKP